MSFNQQRGISLCLQRLEMDFSTLLLSQIVFLDITWEKEICKTGALTVHIQIG